MNKCKIAKLLMLALILSLSLSSCRLGEFLSEADPETEAEAEIKNDSLQQQEKLNVQEDDF